LGKTQFQYRKSGSAQITANKKGAVGIECLVGGLSTDGLGLFSGTIRESVK
jgi:hypothetical protein